MQVAASIMALSLIGASAQAMADEILIRDVTVLSPDRAAALPGVDVLISNGRIVAIGDQLEVSQAGTVIDGTGRYLSPGLIDAHVHLYHATGLNRRFTDDFDRLFAEYFEQMPRSYLYFGFTTVVELNADAEINAQFEAAPVRPDLVHCGSGVVLPDGFMSLDYGRDEFLATFPNYLADPYGTSHLPEGADRDAHTPEAVVASIEEAGGACVKMYYEEALWWPDEPRPDFALPSVRILREVVEAAHARGMPVFLHATTPDGMRAGHEAGVDAFAHGPWEWPQSGFAGAGPDLEVEAIMSRIARSPIRVQPTIRSIQNTRSLFNPGLLDDPAWADVVPAGFLAYLRAVAPEQQRAFLRRFADRLPSTPSMETLQDNFTNRYIDLIARFAAQGGQLSFGTDTAVGGLGWGSPPGLAGYWEMLDWQAAGLSGRDIVRAATIGNAELLGVDADLGRIAPGYQANLVLLAANPWDDIAAWNRIELVIVRGEVIDRAALSARRQEP
ncbi:MULTISPECIES: amidohydrolase family protein [Hyphobacterium]|uniref:Amidohydrolase family protein n=1 Tax=Hyphobacterium vulgare TaxID=1736751 RepID=A0ABV6ZVZ5_9PROT